LWRHLYCGEPWVETEMLRNCIAKMANGSGHSIAEVKSEIENSNPKNRLVQASDISELVSYSVF